MDIIFMSHLQNIFFAIGLASLAACNQDTHKEQTNNSITPADTGTDTATDTGIGNPWITTPAYTLYELAYYHDANGNLDEEAGKTSLEEYFNAYDSLVPLLVSLWAPWCGPCISELPLLNDSVSQDVRILGVAYGSNDLQETLDYRIEEVQEIGDDLGGWKFDNKTALWDNTYDFETEYIRNGQEEGSITIPAFVLLDADGQIRLAIEGSLTSGAQYTRNYYTLYDMLETLAEEN